MSDTIMQDIARFKALNTDEDTRFCEKVYLVKRSYDTLKEVGLSNDMDNSHVLSIIEKKMCRMTGNFGHVILRKRKNEQLCIA